RRRLLADVRHRRPPGAAPFSRRALSEPEHQRRHPLPQRVGPRSLPRRPLPVVKQTGRGKGDAVRLGFAAAKGEVLLILDADMGVAPEDVPKFVRALVAGKGELINGSRMGYPMEGRAMWLLN